MNEIFMIGYWCPECEAFEEEIAQLADGRCNACGCPVGLHHDAKVVQN